MGDDNTELDYPTMEEIGNPNLQQNGAQPLEGAMNEEGVEDPNLQQNQPQHGEQSSEGAVNEEKLTAEELPPKKLAEMQLTVEELRMVANAKEENRNIMQQIVDNQLKKLEEISKAVYDDERVRHLDFREAKEKFDELSEALFMLDLAAEDAAYQANQQEERYKKACAIAAGEKLEEKKDPALNMEYPDQDQLHEEDERKKNPILDEGDLDALHRDVEEQKKDADKLRAARSDAMKKANQLNAKAQEIINRLGYYDERQRTLELADIDAELAKQEQLAHYLTRQIEDADRWAEKFQEAYEQAKQIAEESKLSENLELPGQDEVLNKQPEPDKQEIQNEEDAPVVANYKRSVAAAEEAKTQYTDAKMAIASLSQYIEILQTKSPKELQGNDDIIPMAYVQDGLQKRLRLLPEKKQALEQALVAQKEAEQALAQAKKEYIRRDMYETLFEHWNKIGDANDHYTDPDKGPSRRSGLGKHVENLYGAYYNRHDSQEWLDMLEALGDVKIGAYLDRWHNSAGEYYYNSEEMDELRQQINQAIKQTQKYVDYKKGSFATKLGIGQGTEYLREARGALEELWKIQTSLDAMDRKYKECAQAADKKFDPKPPKKPKVANPQQRTSSVKKQPNINKSKGFGPHI